MTTAHRGPSNTLDMGVYEPLIGRHDLRAGRAAGLERQRGQGPGDLRERVLAAGRLRRRTRKAYVHGYTTRAYQPGPMPPAPGRPSSGSPSLGRRATRTASTGGSGSRPAGHGAGRTILMRRSPTTARRRTRIRAGTSGDVHAHGEEEPGNALCRQTLRLRVQADFERWRRARLDRPGRPQQRRQPGRDRPLPAQLPGQADHPRHRGHHLPRPLQQHRLHDVRGLPRRPGARLLRR